MAWQIKFKLQAKKEFKKLDSYSQKLIKAYLDDKILMLNNPKDLGKALMGNLKNLWRYRVDKFRIICSIQDDALIILVIKIAHRADVYKEL